MSRSTSSRPSSSSRTAPPTTHASWPASSSFASSRIDHHAPRPRRARVDPSRELVVQRVGRARVILYQHAVANQRDRRPGGQLPIELDRDRVHRDGADHAASLPLDLHTCAGQVASKAVRVADRHQSDPGRLTCDEDPAVARALAGRQLPDLREVALPAQDGLEPVDGRRLAERRHAVERDPAAGRVEPGLGDPQRRRAVRDVPDHVRPAGRRLLEPLDLPPREARIRVGRRQVAHQPDDVDRRPGKLGQPPTAHARVELEVNANALGDRHVEDGEVEVGVPRLRHIALGARPEDEDPHARELAPQRERLGHRCDAERERTLAEHRARDVDRAVAVAVRLDHGPELRPTEDAPQPTSVASKRPEVDRDLGAVHQCPERTLGSTSRRSLAIIPASSEDSIAAQWCAVAPAAVASRASMPLARNAAITPVRTSPVPAVARLGWPPSTSTPDPGAAIRVPAPLSRTTHPKRSTVRRTASIRCASTHDASSPMSRPSSPECGVRTRGAGQSPGSSSQSASPSTTTGSRASASTRRTSAFVPSLRPSPGPIASAPALSASSSTTPTASSVTRPSSSAGSGRLTASSTHVSNTWTAGSGPASVTYPASERNAARAERHGAPVIPRDPPTTTTWPDVYLLPSGLRRGTHSRISRVTRPFSVSIGSSPMSATST